jgi:hypothetical protein
MSGISGCQGLFDDGKEESMNQDIRDYAKQLGVKLWQVADAIGITDGQFSRKLRYELEPAEKQNIMKLISQIADTK